MNVRQFLGYTKIDQLARVKLMNELYDYLEDYINFFLPSLKCLTKARVGSKYQRVYDTAQTAYQRVLVHPDITSTVKVQLTAKYATLNPLVLRSKIDQLLKQILSQTHY